MKEISIAMDGKIVVDIDLRQEDERYYVDNLIQIRALDRSKSNKCKKSKQTSKDFDLQIKISDELREKKDKAEMIKTLLEYSNEISSDTLCMFANSFGVKSRYLSLVEVYDEIEREIEKESNKASDNDLLKSRKNILMYLECMDLEPTITEDDYVVFIDYDNENCIVLYKDMQWEEAINLKKH